MLIFEILNLVQQFVPIVSVPCIYTQMLYDDDVCQFVHNLLKNIELHLLAILLEILSGHI